MESQDPISSTVLINAETQSFLGDYCDHAVARNLEGKSVALPFRLEAANPVTGFAGTRVKRLLDQPRCARRKEHGFSNPCHGQECPCPCSLIGDFGGWYLVA